MGIGAEPGRQLSAPQQLVKHLPAVVLRLSPLHATLLAQGFQRVGGGDHGSSSSNKAALPSWWALIASEPSKRGSVNTNLALWP